MQFRGKGVILITEVQRNRTHYSVKQSSKLPPLAYTRAVATRQEEAVTSSDILTIAMKG